MRWEIPEKKWAVISQAGGQNAQVRKQASACEVEWMWLSNSSSVQKRCLQGGYEYDSHDVSRTDSLYDDAFAHGSRLGLFVDRHLLFRERRCEEEGLKSVGEGVHGRIERAFVDVI